MPAISCEIGQFIDALRFEHLPSQVIQGIKTGVIDCLGVALAGSGEETPLTVAAQLDPCSNPDGALEFCGRSLISRERAALINGVCAHVIDYDDVAINGHPSAVLVPCLVALSWNSPITAKEFIAAYACGYEVWARLANAIPEHLHDKGFHPTAILGVVAAAAASSRIMGLTVEQSAHAVSIAASMASGLVGNFGSMVKAYHVGRAAEERAGRLTAGPGRLQGEPRRV